MQALAHCVSIGADVMETDVHQTADGYLVIMHDDTVDRTTTGRGQVIDLTLAQLRTLRLRQNLGGYNEPPTDQSVLTLDELLEAARGRILLNLDIKAPVYAEVADAVRRAGATDGVFIKNFAGVGSPALAALAPYDQLPFMPILRNPEGGSDLARVAAAQIDHAQPIGFELPRMRRSELSQIALFAKAHRLPLLSIRWATASLKALAATTMH